MKEVYLDNTAATKIEPRVLEVMLPYLNDLYANPQSSHSFASKIKDVIEDARKKVAELINAEQNEIIFTSSASEANNLAIKGYLWQFLPQVLKENKQHIIVSSIEHFSVLHTVRRLSQVGFEVSYVGVDRYGIISLKELKNLIKENTILVSIQHANPEIGTIQDIEGIVKVVKSMNPKIVFHTDATATVGILPVDVKKLGVDLLSFSGVTLYGPKGVGVLYIRKGTKVIPLIDGGIQENGLRAGTENVASIVGLGKACEIVKTELEENYEKMVYLRNKLISEIPKKIQYVYLNGHPEKRLPNNVSFSFEFIEGEALTLLLDKKGIYVSSGSACASKALKMSHVLTAIGVDPAVGQGTILFSLSKYNTEEEIDYLLNELPSVVEKLRGLSPLYSYFLKTGQRKPAGPGTDYDEHHHEEG